MAKYITLYEGECESSIIEWLKPKGYKFGRMYKQVLSEIKKIERTLNMINQKTIVTVILDTDTLFNGNSDKNRLKNNIKWLIKNSKIVRIITQNKNLEDELLRSLSLSNMKKLYQHFDSSNKSGYKKVLANLIPEKLERKLTKLDFDLFWTSKILNRFYKQNEIIILNCTLKDTMQ